MTNTISNVLVGTAELSIKYPVGGTYVTAGYTEDGTTMEYAPELADIDVEEETVSIGRVITKETIKITANLAETALATINKAMAGGALTGTTVINLGGGTIKEMSVKLIGTNPAGFARTIEMALCTATGNVAMSYRKGEKTMVPVEFTALNDGTHYPCVITDSTS